MILRYTAGNMSSIHAKCNLLLVPFRRYYYEIQRNTRQRQHSAKATGSLTGVGAVCRDHYTTFKEPCNCSNNALQQDCDEAASNAQGAVREKRLSS